MSQAESHTSILPVLRTIPLFADLNAEEHESIIQRIVLQYFPAGQVIFGEGESAEALYIIRKGKVIVYHPAQKQDEEDVTVSTLSDNDFFGEMALISDKPRNASVKTLTDLEAFILTRDDFNALVSQNPTMAEHISGEFIQRVKANNPSAI